jgi:PadR family transcriptional regulator
MASRRTFSPQTIRVLEALCAEPSAWRHGYTLAKQTGLKSGTLYPILVRLADRGLVEASWEDEHVPGRPRRHLYRLTADGLAAATTAAIPQTTAAREGAAPRGRKPARLAARAAVPWTG